MMEATQLGTTWRDVLRARRTRDKPWLIVPAAPHVSADCSTISYRELYASACRVAAAALRLADGRPLRVIVIADNTPECCICIFGTLLAGLTLVPTAPSSMGRADGAWKRQREALVDECVPALVLGTRAEIDALGRVPGVITSTFEGMLAHDLDANWEPPVVAPDDIALWQYTSGTTARPRAVQLSHANLLHNIRCIGERTAASEADVVACWLPLFHDMGLIGSLLFSVFWGMSWLLMSPRAFIGRPESWLWAIARFGVTFSPAPNFAYEICAGKLADAKLVGLDLSRWRIAFNGAELVHLGTVERFCARFRPYGFSPQAMFPVYGLAEHTVAATLPLNRLGVRVDWVDGRALETRARAIEVAPYSEGARAVTALGAPLSGHRLRIVDPRGAPVPADRHVGEVQLNGPSCMVGYRGDAGAGFSRDGWLRTGDLGYVASGDLYVVGRIKDVIKRGGRQLDAALIESAVRSVEGVRGGGVAVFGVADDASGTERLVVLAETGVSGESDMRALRGRIALAVNAAVTVVPDAVELVQAGSIPRTTSGKIKHSQARLNYLGGIE